ncbi:DUF2017 family protein [Neoactinobaculum massilliense]|uniref:DUF2017 family protein n=1 Tax=Neoactinobaculum massilliense TaxID=2364794 RepID=UPI000F520763|nr:DUF2017 family protein [Neoactinobaculum massilliense]
MRPFQVARGGYVAQADAMERRLIRGLALDVMQMLGYTQEDFASHADEDEAEVLAAYESEFEPGVPASPFTDEAVHRLLPDMSDDPLLAGDLRDLTQHSIAQQKAENLDTFVSALEAATVWTDGEKRLEATVWVPNEEARAAATALNDIRLVLATRLGITDEADELAAQERASVYLGPDGLTITSTDELMVVAYTMVTWWQDSLLRAIRNKELRG